VQLFDEACHSGSFQASSVAVCAASPDMIGFCVRDMRTT